MFMTLWHQYSYAVFLIRSCGTPNGTGRCPAVQCYDNTWAMLAQSKNKLGQYIANGSSIIRCWQLENAYEYTLYGAIKAIMYEVPLIC